MSKYNIGQILAFKLLLEPDPGAEIMERMKKLEAVAEAAREVEKFIFPIKGENLVKVIGSDINKLVQALAEDGPCQYYRGEGAGV